jgi:hypothetical protein
MEGGTCQCKNMQKESKTYKHMQKTCKNTVNESRTLEKLQKYRCMFWQVQPIDQATIPAANESPMPLFVKKNQPHLFGAEQEPETPEHHPPPLPPFPPN